MPRVRLELTASSIRVSIAMVLLIAPSLSAEPPLLESEDPKGGTELSSAARPWNVLVDSDEASLQRLALTGIVHWQHAWVDSSDENGNEDEFRRFRFGADALILDHFRLAGKVNFNPDDGRFYKSISQTYLAYSPYGNEKEDFERSRISVGKLKPHFTNEHSLSPKRIKTFERSLLPNQLNPLKSTGVFVGGSGDRYSGAVAIYSGERSDEFGGFGEGVAVVAKSGFDPDGPWQFGLDYLGVWNEV